MALTRGRISKHFLVARLSKPAGCSVKQISLVFGWAGWAGAWDMVQKRPGPSRTTRAASVTAPLPRHALGWTLLSASCTHLSLFSSSASSASSATAPLSLPPLPLCCTRSYLRPPSSAAAALSSPAHLAHHGLFINRYTSHHISSGRPCVIPAYAVLPIRSLTGYPSIHVHSLSGVAHFITQSVRWKVITSYISGKPNLKHLCFENGCRGHRHWLPKSGIITCLVCDAGDPLYAGYLAPLYEIYLLPKHTCRAVCLCRALIVGLVHVESTLCGGSFDLAGMISNIHLTCLRYRGSMSSLCVSTVCAAVPLRSKHLHTDGS